MFVCTTKHAGAPLSFPLLLRGDLNMVRQCIILLCLAVFSGNSLVFVTFARRVVKRSL